MELPVSPLEPQRNVHEPDEDRHLDPGADDGDGGCSRVDAEDRHSHGNGKLEVIPFRSEFGGSQNRQDRIIITFQ